MRSLSLMARTSVSVALALAARGQVASPHVRVDAFGYRPADQKVAILREPVVGHDAPAAFTPGTTIQLRRSSDNAVVFSAARTAWNGGNVHTDSGDRAWRFDFSSVTTPGTYHVFDPTTGVRSEDFAIAEDVYDEVLEQAVRSYYYQRCGVAKLAAHAGASWSDGACHTANVQCRSILAPSDPGTARDLSGGWHDAGDYNKYVPYTCNALDELLSGYLSAPCAFADDYGIPESGNGVPDLLDEVRVELTWLLKMQNPDGSVLHKRSAPNYSGATPPSTDTALQYYGTASSSATIQACGSFARAAWAWRTLPGAANQAFGTQLETAAVNAWNWLVANPAQIPLAYTNQGFTTADAEPSPHDKTMRRVAAAAWLFRLTGNTSYRTFFDANFASSEIFASSFLSPFGWENSIGLLDYTDTPGASSPERAAIRTAYLALISGAGHLSVIQSDSDPYLAYLPTWAFTWGSNRTKCNQGMLFLDVARFSLDPANANTWRQIALRYVHAMHGVNPPGWTYLSNMGAFGAPQSLTQFYHGWFADGSPWDQVGVSQFGPPPGFVPGGPNPYYAPDASWTGGPIVPPQNQPVLKSYRDWNADWPEASYQVTENHIPYQAAYVALLGQFAARDAGLPTIACATGGTSSLFCFGDGSGSACPCTNTGSYGNGCAHSANSAGAHLAATGIARVSEDTLVLTGNGTTDGAGLYIQGDARANGGLGTPFGDGLLCVSGTILRLAVAGATGGASSYPSGTAPPTNIPIHTAGLVPAGATRHYQLWFRDAQPLFCTSATYNLTNAATATWAP